MTKKNVYHRTAQYFNFMIHQPNSGMRVKHMWMAPDVRKQWCNFKNSFILSSNWLTMANRWMMKMNHRCMWQNTHHLFW